METDLRRRKRRQFLSRIKSVLDAWPVPFVVERLDTETTRVRIVVGNAVRGFVIYPIYPDDPQPVIEPDAILTHSLTDVIQACQRFLR